uniref:Uncharacterized protein n=1 Tax=Molossus molossus TaxID=27622 RepID=A0A7J8DPW8_MOLMO|nr:hypothetical protein HJG59_009291 [Molossus molossus]
MEMEKKMQLSIAKSSGVAKGLTTFTPVQPVKQPIKIGLKLGDLKKEKGKNDAIQTFQKSKLNNGYKTVDMKRYKAQSDYVKKKLMQKLNIQKYLGKILWLKEAEDPESGPQKICLPPSETPGTYPVLTLARSVQNAPELQCPVKI